MNNFEPEIIEIIWEQLTHETTFKWKDTHKRYHRKGYDINGYLYSYTQIDVHKADGSIHKLGMFEITKLS